MPIYGLTDPESLRYGCGLPRIARLYKGAEKPESGNKPGADLKHFRVEFEEQYTWLEESWEMLYGKTPTQFGRVFLAQNTLHEAFPTWKEEWNATTLLHRCDGRTQTCHYEAASSSYSHKPIDCAVSGNPACKCKPVGRLNLILPELIEATGVMGFVSISTHSLNDILTISSYLNDIFVMARKLTGIPFVFGRAQESISVPKPQGKPGERIRVAKSLLYIHVDPDYTLAQLLPVLAQAQPLLNAGDGMVIKAPEAPRQLPASTAASEKPADHWTRNTKRIAKFIKWAQDKLNMDDAAVFAALHTTDRTIQHISDFTQDERHALAALVAYNADYNTKDIGKLTTNAKLFVADIGIEVYHLACEIAANVADAEDFSQDSDETVAAPEGGIHF
jgi:hypothetical protein